MVVVVVVVVMVDCFFLGCLRVPTHDRLTAYSSATTATVTSSTAMTMLPPAKAGTITSQVPFHLSSRAGKWGLCIPITSGFSDAGAQCWGRQAGPTE